jgi:O-acetylserine/cysteine efflux transporter
MSAQQHMSGRHILLALSVVLVWALNFLVIRIGLDDLPPLFFAALRFTVTAFPAVLIVGRQGMPWRLILGAGTCIGVGYFSLLFVGMKLGMPPGFAALVSQGQVVFTVLFSATLLRETPSPWQSAGIGIALCGLALAGFERMGALNPAGLVLVVMAALFWGLGNVVIKRLGRGLKVDGFRLVLWMSLVPPLPNFLLSAWLEEGQWAHLAALSGSGLFALVYTAFASTLFGWGAWAWLLRRYSAPQVAPFSLLVPVVALAMSVAWMGEEFSPLLAVASALLLGGVGVTICEPWLARIRPALTGPVAAWRR